MRFYVCLLLITFLICSGCAPLQIDEVILETQLQNGQKAISIAAESDAEKLAADEYSRAVKLLKFARQAREREELAQSMEFAYQAELVAQTALYKAKQQQARDQIISIREQIYQELITQKDYEIEMVKIRNEMKELENEQALKEIQAERQRAGSLTSDLATANDAIRHAGIYLWITRAEIYITIAKQTYPEIVDTAEYERVQSTIKQATSQLERKEFDEAEKVATDAQAQASKLYEQAVQFQKLRTAAETTALIAIERIQVKIERAESLNAATHDPKQFQQSQNQLERAKKAMIEIRYGEARQAAEGIEQIIDKVIAISEIAEYRRRAQQELTAKIKRAEGAVATLKAAITEQTETKVPQFAPQLFELATSALVTAEAALAKKEYSATIDSAQQGSDYLKRAIDKTKQQNTAQTSLVEATQQIPKAVIIEHEEGVTVRISGNLFATTSTRLKEAYFPTFLKLASIMQQEGFIDYVARIEGHSDSLGPAASNRALSEKRANAVKTFLIDKGKVIGKRLTAVGLGEEQPIDPNSQEKNRRIDIIISKAP
ncbi:MAG: OmpA family protein [Candidatus Poribacteria bacterium]|nr:OmpA family protein [Candidatus Poribacteria bacterium]